MSSMQEPEVCYSILESLPVGLCIVDIQNKIVLWSEGAERITGHLRHETIGHSCVGETLLHCDQPECEFCHEESPLSRAMKTAQPVEAIGFVHHKKGHEIPVRVRAVPVRNAHGSIIGAAEVFEEQQQASPDHREDDLEVPGCVDEATGIESHAVMQAHLRETLGIFNEVHVPFGILCLRVEGLEYFRANFGSGAVALLLRVVARTIEASLWKSDHVGRWADDQFLVILNGCREEAIASVRERLRRMLASDGIEWWGDRLSLPVSIGQATAQAGDSIESLMGRALKSLDAAVAGPAHSAAAGSSSSSSLQSSTLHSSSLRSAPGSK
jgi:diguanylate cyclase (GGDEF)-like protein/PAS domain S-box-containing protein